MHAHELDNPIGAQNPLNASPDNAGAFPARRQLTHFTRALNTLKKAGALSAVLVAGAFSAAIPAIPAYASPTTLTITTYPQNSTGVPMVAAALTNHVMRGTPEVINMFVNGTLALECKSRECATDLDVLPGQTAAVTADVGPRGTVPYTPNAIVSASATVIVVHHIIACHGTTCV